MLDLHGWTGSADDQSHGHNGWKHLASQEGFAMIWPDGMGDSPNNMGSWNCSKSIGPMGPTCDLNREPYGLTECYYSCPLCDEATSCDWSSCYDDIGFIDFVIQDASQRFCLDLDQLHLSGVSNGGMFAYFAASTATDCLGQYQIT